MGKPRYTWMVLGVCLLIAIPLAIASVSLGLSARGRPFPSLFLDPFGRVSGVKLPSWTDDVSSDGQVAFPDLLEAIDGDRFDRAVRGYGDLPQHRLLADLERRAAAEPAVTLTFAHKDGLVVVVRRVIRRLSGEETVFLHLIYLVLGAFVLWSGIIVLMIARDERVRVVYALLSLATFVFVATLYDYHTTARLVPAFYLGWIGAAIGCIWMGYSFPEPPRRLRRLFRALAITATLALSAIAVPLLAGPLLQRDFPRLRLIVSDSFGASLMLLGTALLARLPGSRGQRRAELLSAVWGLVPSPIVIGLGTLNGGGLFYLTLPLLICLFPLSIGYALIRHNILSSSTILTRRLFVVPLLLLSFLGATVTWRAVRGLAGPLAAQWGLMLSAAVVFVVAYVTMWRGVRRFFFVAAERFRPSIEQLSDHLSTIEDPARIAQAIIYIVTDSLPIDRVEVLRPQDLTAVSQLPPDAATRLQSGELVWTAGPPAQRELFLPMRSLRRLRCVLRMTAKDGAALYTSDDLALLRTIATLGAVAMHNAEVQRELEAIRQVEVDATRDEKRQALALIAAEISHEIAYPLNFFRYLLKQGSDGDSWEQQDLEIGREEVDRLDRMLSTLRKLQLPVANLTSVAVHTALLRALKLVREALQQKRLRLEVSVPEGLTVIAEADALLQVLANLLRNAAQAAPPGGAVGIRFLRGEADCCLEVWDSGSGINESVAGLVFDPWVTTKPEGSGLGLAITHRIVRRFGWSIEHRREAEQTVFRIHIPHSALVPDIDDAEAS